MSDANVEEGRVDLVVVARGEVAEAALAHAEDRIGTVLDKVGEPVLFARVKLTRFPDPAGDRPAMAQATVDVNGDVLRAQVAAPEMIEAIDLLQARLRGKVQHRTERLRTLNRRPPSTPEGEWRSGDRPTERPDHFVRPADERELVRHKSLAVEPITIEEAAFDMDQLDFDFYLYRDLDAGVDALLEHDDQNGYRVSYLGEVERSDKRTVPPVEPTGLTVPTLSVEAAVERLRVGGEPFVFFEDGTTGRGSVAYRRYDGHDGLITLE